MPKFSPMQRRHRAICDAIESAERADVRYTNKAQLLAEIDAGIEERERSDNTEGRYHKDMCKMAKTLRASLVKLGSKKRDLEKRCLSLFVGYPVVPDLIHARDLDLPHEWKSISQLRRDLSQPLSGLFSYQVIDKWKRRALESYTDDQLERELLAVGQHYIEGTRRNGATTEYLLP
jgi:hypothetical protein